MHAESESGPKFWTRSSSPLDFGHVLSTLILITFFCVKFSHYAGWHKSQRLSSHSQVNSWLRLVKSCCDLRVDLNDLICKVNFSHPCIIQIYICNLYCIHTLFNIMCTYQKQTASVLIFPIALMSVQYFFFVKS